MAGSARIIDLRKLLAERFPHAPTAATTRLATGLPLLDGITGGLPRSAITELISPAVHSVAGGPRKSTGSASIVHALIHNAYSQNYFLALIDGRDSFDPYGLDACSLRHLLWVRCSKASEAIRAADLLLRDGNFPLVMLDLVLNSPEELRKVPQTNWYRLQRLVELIPTACLVLTRYEMVASAQVKLVLENSWNLESLEKQNPISQIRIDVKRSRLHAEAGSQKSEVG
jgi:hypothetical protein